jgi:hypothetical protein
MSNYGTLKRNPEITTAFKNGRIFPDHKYYYIGRSGMPYAVVGIHNDYKLQSRLWEEIDPAGDQLNTLIGRMYDRHGDSPHGSSILDPAGQQIGIWYSTWDYTAVKMEEGNRVVIHSPYVPRDAP